MSLKYFVLKLMTMYVINLISSTNLICQFIRLILSTDEMHYNLHRRTNSGNDLIIIGLRVVSVVILCLSALTVLIRWNDFDVLMLLPVLLSFESFVRNVFSEKWNDYIAQIN